MNESPKRLSVIIASYNDKRIERAIRSVRYFDDVNTVRLVVIDGGSSPDVIELIRSHLTPDDVLISERDRGIFDGLNKGLDNCSTEFLGWLGSDDLFTGKVMASDVLRNLENNDLYIANVAFFRGTKVRRITYALPSRFGLVKFGIHNPHYGTFGRVSLLRSERFDLSLLGSDIDYFHKIFDRKPRIVTDTKIATLQFEGGFSNASYRKMLNINWQLLATYARFNNVVIAPVLLLTKVGYTALMRARFTLFPVDVRSLDFPVLAAQKDITL